MYTEDARNLMRKLIGLGCPTSNIRAIVCEIAHTLGVEIGETDIPSPHTCGRAILEGGIAAMVQIVHEAAHTNG